MISPAFSRKLLAAVGAVTILCSAATAQTKRVATPPSSKQGIPAAATAPVQTLKPESWDQLRVERSDLHADAPLTGEKTSFPGFTREFIRVQWRMGDPIELFVLRPVGVQKPPVVLYLYGYPTDSDRFRNLELDRNLTRNGFAAVGFASALTGQRFHNRPLNKWFVSELQESIATSVHDVQMILNYLEDRDDLDMSHVGMFGEGSGGAIAILSAAVDPRIKSIDVMEPWADWPDFLARSSEIPEAERSKYVKPEFLSKVHPVDPILWMSKLADRPFRVQEIPFDTSFPESVRTKLKAAAPPNTRIVEYKTPQDYINNVSKNARMLDWIEAALKPASSGTVPGIAERMPVSKSVAQSGRSSTKPAQE